jgi:hypothetical protein
MLLGDKHFPAVVDDDNDDHPGRQVRHHLLALGWTPERTRDVLLEILTQEIQARRQEIRAHARQVNKAKQLALRVSLIPETRTLDRLLRYEAALERSLYRALHELHRLQAARARGAGATAGGARRGRCRHGGAVSASGFVSQNGPPDAALFPSTPAAASTGETAGIEPVRSGWRVASSVISRHRRASRRPGHMAVALRAGRSVR